MSGERIWDVNVFLVVVWIFWRVWCEKVPLKKCKVIEPELYLTKYIFTLIDFWFRFIFFVRIHIRVTVLLGVQIDSRIFFISFFIVYLNRRHSLQNIYCFESVLFHGSCVVVSYKFTPGFFSLRQQGSLLLPKLLFPVHSPPCTPPLHLSLPRIYWKIWTASFGTLVDQARTEHRCRASCGKWAEYIIWFCLSLNDSLHWYVLSCNTFPHQFCSKRVDNS